MITVSIRRADDFSYQQDSIISSLPFGENEKNRLNSIKNPIYKSESLAALVALNDIAQDLSSNLAISRTNDKKPYFEHSNLHFSLSHSCGLSVAVIGDMPIGIDIEILDSGRDISKLINRFFSTEEKELLQTASDSALAFYSVWTKKEALAKISGKGLSEVANQDSLTCFSHQYILKIQKDTYVMSVCSHTADSITINNSYKELTIYEL